MKKLLFLLLLAAMPMCAQTTVAPFVNPKVQFFNGAVPCSGCLLSTFAAGQSTPLATYSESTGTTPNSNPIQLDSNGMASIYLTSASYKFALKTAANVPIWTQDGVSWLTPLTTFPQGSVAGNFDITQPTAAINGANQSSFSSCIHGTFFNVASLDDKWCFQNVIGTGTSPTSTLTLTHSGSSGAATFSIPGNVSVGGTLGAKTLEAVRYADQFAGAECGAKITAADTDLGATAGEIWVNQACGTNWTTAPTISNYHKLKMIQGGVYSLSVGWTETSVHDIGIECSPGTVFSFTGAAGFTIDGSALANGSRRDFISNCIFSGNALVADAVTLNKVVESTFINLTGMNATATAIHCKGCLENTFISPRSSLNNNLGPVTYSTIPAVGFSLDTNGSIQSNVNHLIAPVFEALTGGIGISCVSGVANVVSAGTSEANATGLNVASSCVGLQVTGTDFEANTTADATLAGPGTVLQNISAFSSSAALVQLNSGATNTVILGGKIFGLTIASGATNSMISGARFHNITNSAGATGTSFNNVDYSVNGTGGTFTDSAASTTHYQVRNLFSGAYEADQFNNTKGIITPQIGSISGALVFATNSGAQTPWSITDTGGANSIVPDTNNSHNIGSSGQRVSTVFTTVLNASTTCTVGTLSCTVTVGTGNVTTAGTAVTNGTTQDQTGITVTGAATTDACTANLGAALPATWQTGIRFWCDVTATNTVTVHLQNPTAGSITPAATQVNVRVTR